MQDQLTIDITILHVAGSNKIRIHFPERTRRLWKALTGKTRYYLATAEVCASATAGGVRSHV